MIGKKINQLATELAPVSTDLTIIGDPTTGVSKKITLAQLGAIFSGAVSFYTNLAGFPATGDINVIYCAKDTQKLYLWSGSAYVEVFPSQALLDTYQLRSEKGVSNGYASLDSTGKVPISQLPSSIMEYKGTWNAATNTPTLANGTGDTGDVYICNVAGTVNFGAGPITFAVGDYVIYSGSIWQRSSGAVGTVTSVAASITGNAIGITGTPVTTSGTLAFAFAGTGAQYIKGDGTLATFPSTISQAEKLITEVYNSTGATLTKGTIVYINGGQGNLPTVTKALATGDSTSAQTFGVVQADITNNNNGYVVVAGKLSDLDTQAYTPGTQLYLSSTTAGTWTSTKQYAPNHLVYIGIVVRAHPTQGIVEVKIQNGYELDELHNVAAQTPTNNDGLFWESATSLWKNKSISTILGGTPITGSGNVNAIPKFTDNSVLGNSVMEDDGNFVSMRGLKLNASAGVGNTINFQQGTGITAGGLGYSTIGASSTTGFIFYIDQNTTSRNFILDTSTITSDAQRTYSMPATSGTLALVSQLTGGTVTSVGLSSATSGVTIGSSPITTSGTITLAIATASGSQQGLLSSTDWTTFNNKQNALTNPVTGTGTTNYLPKFTGTSTIGNSIVQDDGSTLTIGGALSGRNATFTSSTANIGIIGTGTFSYLQLGHNGGATKYSYLVATNDGMLDIESNIVKFTDYSGASERMRINASGNVSIGNTNDTYKLDVSGTGRFQGSVTINGSNSCLAVTDGTNTSFIGMASSGGAYGNGTVAGDIVVRGTNGISLVPAAGAFTALRIASTGAATFSSSVTAGDLISTSYGTARVQITSTTNSANAALRLSAKDSGGTTKNAGLYYVAGTTNANTFLSFAADDNNYQFNVLATGNVGIGTTNPKTVSSGLSLTIGDGASSVQPYLALARTASGGYWAGIRWYDNNTIKSYIQEDSDFNLRFGTSDTERMRITSGGNVGIGTTSPTEKLDLQGTMNINGASGTYLQVQYNGGNRGYIGTANAVIASGSTGDFGIAATSNLIFGTGGSLTERMRITSGGNVGIGTTSIRNNGAGQTAMQITGADFPLFTINGTSTGIGLNFGTGSATGYIGTYTNHGFNFFTNDTERMRITSGGYIKASPTGTYFSTSTSFSEFGNNITNGPALFLTQTNTSFVDNVLFVEGYTNTTNNTWYLISGYNRTANAYKFRVADSGNVTNTNNSYGAISDIKLKENIIDASPKLSDLLKVKIKNFNYKGSEEKQLGVIAQELETVFPSMIEVHTDRDAQGKDLGTITKSVKYSVFVPMLIKAVQELKAELDTLKNK